MVQIEDASYKQLYSSPAMVRNLVSGFIPDGWLQGLDFSTLECVPGHYVSDDLRQRANDMVWRVRADDEWLYLYLMMEFQSTVDHGMQEVGELIDKLADIVKGDEELKRIFLNVLPGLIGRRSGNTLDVPVVNDLVEMKMKLSQSFKVWAHEYIQQGRIEGEQKGRADAATAYLQRQLTARFGALPEYAVTKIEGATEKELERWALRLLRAETLDDVFKDPLADDTPGTH